MYCHAEHMAQVGPSRAMSSSEMAVNPVVLVADPDRFPPLLLSCSAAARHRFPGQGWESVGPAERRLTDGALSPVLLSASCMASLWYAVHPPVVFTCRGVHIHRAVPRVSATDDDDDRETRQSSGD